jgi:ParB family chromosome partitioning protein
VKELAAWIESNLLLDLQTATFDRTDAALLPEAGSCHDCPKRTGANSLLFLESDRDQCLDRECYQAKMSAHVAASIQRNPELIQISTAWGTHANGVLGRGQYIEIAVAKASRNGHQKQTSERKKCTRMKQAIIVEGGGCGRMVDVFADLTCETHHADSRKAREALERARTEHRKQNERRNLELVTRRRVLAAILEKVSAPLSKADLELVAREFFGNLPQEYRTLLIKRHTTAEDKKPKNG